MAKDHADGVKAAGADPRTHPEAIGAHHVVLEHVGELHLRIRAPDYAALLVEAARALAETFGDAGDTVPEPPELVEVRAPDREALLVDWLNELIYRAEAAGRVPAQVDVLDVTETHLRARVRDARPPALSALVKAATHHHLHVTDVPGGVEADVLLDI